MKKVIALLKSTMPAVLATSSGDKPRASIVDIVVVGADDAIIMSTPPESIKAGNLKRNARVSLSVQNLPKGFVTIDGAVTTDVTPAQIEAYNQALFNSHTPYGELIKKVKVAYFRIIPEKAYYKEGPAPVEVFTA